MPANTAQRIISRLIEGKKIIYGWLGITVQELNDNLVSYFGLPDNKGALVAKIMENSPAQKAGIKAGDVIKKLDDIKINNVRELLAVVGRTDSGKKIKAVLIRDKKVLNVEIIVSQRPDEVNLIASDAAAAPQVNENTWRGFTVENLGLKSARKFGIDEKEGVVVVNIEPHSLADASGIIPGDVIIEINKIRIRNVSEYNDIVKGLKGDCLIRTQRGYFLIKGNEIEP
jgi:serine protease Do